MTNEKLPNDLLWDEGGHLSEVARTALADGEEEILPAEALVHLASCDECAVGMGDAAMLSTRMAELLATHAPSSSRSAERLPLPFPAIAAALFLAGLGTLPTLIALPAWSAEASFFLTRTLPFFFRSALALVRGSASMAPAVSYVSAALLLMAGVAIARSVPAKSINTAKVSTGARS